MASPGQNKRTADDAGIERYDNEFFSTDPIYSFTGTSPDEQEPKRPCYPDPTEAQTHYTWYSQVNDTPDAYQTPTRRLFAPGQQDSTPYGTSMLNTPLSIQPNTYPFQQGHHPFGQPTLPQGTAFPVATAQPSPTPAPRSSQVARVKTRSQDRVKDEPSESSSGFDLRLAGFSLEKIGLVVPAHIESLDREVRLGEMAMELQRQLDNPPALPPSKVPDLEEKPIAEEWLDVPSDADDEERDRIIEANNRIAATNQKIERDRNNQAAKKSREKRLESLDNTRIILNNMTAERNFWCLLALSLGAPGNA